MDIDVKKENIILLTGQCSLHNARMEFGNLGNFYIIQPMLSWWDRKKINSNIKKNGKKILEPFEYSSENNKTFLKIKEIKKLIKNI